MFRRNVFFFFIDHESENAEKLKVLRRRRTLRDASDPLSLPTNNFIHRFRLSKKAFVLVLDTINLESGSRSTYIPPILRLGATLEFLGGGGYQWLTGNDFGVSVGQSTLFAIISQTTAVMEEKLCPLWIKWEILSETIVEDTKQWFYRKFGMPGVVACIDGTHLYIQRPKENEEAYFNRKGKHSLNAIIICDHRMRTIGINPKYFGSAHDSLAWKHSNERAFFERIFNERDHNSWLLGDSGYPLEPWLLTPYRSSNDVQENYFNEVHAKARNIIERCIGVYKGRWRIIMEERKSKYDPSKIAVFANVCAALHNICIHHNMDNIFTVEADEIHIMESFNRTPAIPNGRLKQQAERIRNQIKESLFTQNR